MLGILLQIVLVLLGLGCVYFAFGYWFCKAGSIKCNVTMLPIMGFSFCMVIFMFIEIPAHILGWNLSVLAYLYIAIVIVAGLLMAFISKRGQVRVEGIEKKELLFLCVVIMAQILFQFFNMLYGSTWDTGQYIGQISTALYTDTIRQFEPFSGKEMGYFDAQNLFATYEMHSAVVCKLLHIHPLIYVHRIIASLEMIFVNILPYNIALQLFKGNFKQARIAIISMLIINLFSYTLYTWSGFLFLRAGESKSMLAMVILPLILYCTILLAQNEKGKMIGLFLVLAVTLGVGICKSGAFIIPVALFAELLPVVLLDKRWKLLFLYVISNIPCAVVCVYQMAIRGIK